MSILVTGGKLADGTTAKTTEVVEPYESCGAKAGPTMVVARHSHGQVKMKNGDIFVCGGRNDREEYIDSCEIWSGRTKEFCLLNDKMHLGRCNPAVVCLPDGKILVISGSTKESYFTQSCEIFNPATESFHFLHNKLPVPMRYVSACFLPNGEFLVFGLKEEGCYCFQFYSRFESEFGVSVDIDIDVLPTACVFNMAGKVLLIGSAANSTTKTLLYDIYTGALSDGPQTNIGRTFPFVCTYGDGKLFVGGPAHCTGNFTVGEFFDAPSNSFKTGCMLAKYRYCAVASRL